MSIQESIISKDRVSIEDGFVFVGLIAMLINQGFFQMADQGDIFFRIDCSESKGIGIGNTTR